MNGNAFERVDSEIALTALLAAAVTAFELPVNGFYTVFKVAALCLLVLTLLRRMAIMQGAHLEGNILQVTTHLLDFATFSSILYCFQILLRWLNSILDIPLSFPLIFGVVTPILLFCGFLVWEIAYASALAEGKRIFRSAAKQHQGTFLEVILDAFADRLSESRQSKLSDFQKPAKVEELPLEDLYRIGLGFLVTSAAFFIALLGYAATVWLSGYIFSVEWPTRLLIFITTLITSAIVRMWYSKYGIVKAEDRNGGLVFLTEVGVFLLIGVSIFPV